MPDLFPFLPLLGELEKFKFVERTMPLSGGRHENDAEHSWNLAMWVMVLAPEYPGLDVRKCMEYALIHDLGELYAGDTYIYDEQAMTTKLERERESLEALLAHFPEGSRERMTKTCHDYDAKVDDEAWFVYELDKIQPVVLIRSLRTGAWQNYGITKQRLLDAKLPKLSDKFGFREFLVQYVDEAEKEGAFPDMA